ncbi:GldG family protein [Sphingomonas glaciei]|uniref:GldG family protein n=1 Tax=Sphingomonas glaciei TaxID=2938948 RepID=A0ABY5MUU7_9SPHN|nr:GldG family protein [Sphingomonas glaciei]UUR07746.1 GldG family protein [Sphingomonas glaciei]
MRLGLLLAIAAALCSCRGGSQPAATTELPELALLSSLPIAFGENFGLDQGRSPLLGDLEGQYRVIPVDGPEQLKPGGLLLAAQPQALTAERLVALDRWVRDGGRLVLLADPALRFESSRPLGDRFRPPLRYPDTGLLKHWGVVLDDGVDGRVEASATDLGRGIRLEASGLGSLTRAGGACTLSPTRAVARCRIGKGYATIVADADFALSAEPEQRAAVVALLNELSDGR